MCIRDRSFPARIIPSNPYPYSSVCISSAYVSLTAVSYTHLILAIKTASINTAKHFKIPDIGAIGIGYKANFSVVDDIRALNILSVYKEGKEIYNADLSLIHI